MRSRAVRLALQALFVALLAAAGYVVWERESAGTAIAKSAHAFDARASAVTRTLLEIKSAQPGYVAAGQGEDYWVTRVGALAVSTREGLAALQPLARTGEARTEIDAANGALEDFEQMDRRAREYVRGGQRLLASDLVFSDGIEKMDAAVAAIERARTGEGLDADRAIARLRYEQLMALGGAAAAGFLIVLALVPLPRRDTPSGAEPATARETTARERASSMPPSIAAAATSVASPTSRTPAAQVTPAPPPVAVSAPPERPARVPSPAVQTPAVPRAASAGVDLAGIAALCSDLARVFDTRSLPGALERAAALLNASGLVIWVADPDGRELAPVIAHGYPPHLLSRMGTIAKDAENATAAAFRTGVVQIVKGDQISPGAIAAPLLSPSGPLGVMAAELLQDGERRDATRAVAAIVAAQLSTLMAPPPARGKAHATI